MYSIESDSDKLAAQLQLNSLGPTDKHSKGLFIMSLHVYECIEWREEKYKNAENKDEFYSNRLAYKTSKVVVLSTRKRGILEMLFLWMYLLSQVVSQHEEITTYKCETTYEYRKRICSET